MQRQTDNAAAHIHKHQHIRILLFHHLADLIDRVGQSCTGFVINHRDDRVLAGRQFFVDHFSGKRLSPVNLKFFDIAPARLGDRGKLVTERTAHAAENGFVFLDTVANAGFPDTGCR